MQTDRPRTPCPAGRSTANVERRGSRHRLYRREPVDSSPWHLPCEFGRRGGVRMAIEDNRILGDVNPGRAVDAAIPRNAVTIGTVVGSATDHQSSNCAPDREFDCGLLV